MSSFDDHWKTPHGNGYAAGYRIGPYEGATTTPPCPYTQGTPDYAEWQEGFDQATGDLWDPVIQGWVD